MNDNIDLEKSPETAIIHPGYHFKGLELPLLTLGSKLIFYRLIVSDDDDNFFACAMLYVLSRPRAEVEKLSRDVDAARVKIYDWIDEQRLTAADLEQARALVRQILEDAKAGEVQVVNEHADTSGKI